MIIIIIIMGQAKLEYFPRIKIDMVKEKEQDKVLAYWQQHKISY